MLIASPGLNQLSLFLLYLNSVLFFFASMQAGAGFAPMSRVPRVCGGGVENHAEYELVILSVL